ncbi:MAG: beta-N-acetylhexosaminidase [Granulosicoccaceae bacterium]
MPDQTVLIQLHVNWQFGPNGYIDSGKISLHNHSEYVLEHAKLCLSGMVRFNDNTVVSGATLFEYISNYAVFTPDQNNPPTPDSIWCIEVGEPDYPMRHYTEGIVSAYLCLQDGKLLDVPITQTTAQQGSVLYTPKDLNFEPAVGEILNDDSWSITPYPNEVGLQGARNGPTGLDFGSPVAQPQAVVESFIGMAERLFPEEQWYKPQTATPLAVWFSQNNQYADEQYSLRFDSDHVMVVASNTTGFLYGLISLGQLLRASINNTSTAFPTAGDINDHPAHEWRGCHLDVARQFYSVDTIERFLCVMAWNKLNRFHWHLSDDEAWRVEIDAYPELTNVGAWRGHGKPVPPVLGTGSQTIGGFYTQQHISRVVKTASRLGVIVVPEFDMPGHSYAALQSITELADPLEPDSYRSLQGFPNNCLNPVRDETYTFIEHVFDELLPLFPSNYWYVGADEVPEAAWHVAPSINGAENSETARTLQAVFLKRIHALLKERGITTGAWQEAAIEGGIGTDSSYLVAWLDTDVAKQLASRGYKVVVSAGQAYYLDMAMADEWSEPGLAWAGSVCLEQTYAFDPTAGWGEHLKQQCMGVQACIWSEQMTNTTVFDYLVFPRLSAMAETAWTKKHNKDWKRFSALCNTMPTLFSS